MAKIQIMMEMDPPAAAAPDEQAPSKPTPEEQVRELLNCVERGNTNNTQDWLTLSKIYNELCSMDKPSSRAQALIKLIEPIMHKYGYFEVAEDK